MPRPLLTLGYGNRELGEVLALLGRHEVRFLVDVRTAPYSRFSPAFTKENLASAVQCAGVRYVFMGDTIGGRPQDEACYDAEGHVDYRACRNHPTFLAGFDRLAAAWKQDLGVAVFCSELRPEQCHRTKLIADALVDRGVSVAHVDADGAVIGHEAVMDRLHDPQLNLLGDSGAATRSRRAIAAS